MLSIEIGSKDVSLTSCYFLSSISSIITIITLLRLSPKRKSSLSVSIFSSPHEALMCTLSILNIFVIALHLLAQHIIGTHYSFLSVEAYHSIIKSKKLLIVVFVDLLGTRFILTRSIKDVLMGLYSFNRTTVVSWMFFVLMVKDERKRMVKGWRHSGGWTTSSW